MLLPFTPASRQDQTRNNMVAWLAARNDGDRYGELILYRMPKNVEIQGPLMIDSLNGLKNQSAWHAKQLNELQSMRLQMEHQQKRSWIFGSIMAILLSIAIISPWFVSVILIVLASILAVWRIAK